MKRALVTGGSGGIGAAICERLATNGLHVIVHANSNIDRARSTVDNIKADQTSDADLSVEIDNQPEFL